MTHNIESIFDSVADRYEPEDDGKPLGTFPVNDPQDTGRPIDAIINNPTFMTQASTGQPVPERTSEERERSTIRCISLSKSEQRAISRQKLRISLIQSRGEESFYNGSAANDNTPLQKAITA